jgi:predicted nucleotidyltransferase
MMLGMINTSDIFSIGENARCVYLVGSRTRDKITPSGKLE